MGGLWFTHVYGCRLTIHTCMGGQSLLLLALLNYSNWANSLELSSHDVIFIGSAFGIR